MKKFCSPLRAHATYMISFEKKKLLSLTKEGLKLHQDSTLCYICRKNTQKLSKDKRFHKVRDHCHFMGKFRRTAHSICNLRFNVPNEIHAVFQNGSNYEYHFIMKQLAN